MIFHSSQITRLIVAASAFLFLLPGAMGLATELPPELAAKDEAFLRACQTRTKDELRVFQATLYQQQKRCSDTDDFDGAKLFKEARELMQITPDFIEESLRPGGDSVRPLRETVWATGRYRQLISPTGYMCSRNDGQWSRGGSRIIPHASTPRILEFTNNSPTLVWMLVDKNTAIQIAIGWSGVLFRPATDCSFNAIISERSQIPVFQAEAKARAIDEARAILRKAVGTLCLPLAKRYAQYLELQLQNYAKQGKFDKILPIQNRIAALAGRGSRRSAASTAPLPDESLKGSYRRESEGGHRKIADGQALKIDRPESFDLKDINGRVHQFTLKQSSPDGYLHYYDISPAFVNANKAIVGKASSFLYILLYKDDLNLQGSKDYIRFRAQ